MKLNIADLAWDKMQGLIPAIVQEAKTKTILMMAYMNKEALEKTLTTRWVTFYSRSKNQLWVKGKTSGHKLQLVDIVPDCDNDTLLITAHPTGPTCHTGNTSCFDTMIRIPTKTPEQENKTDWEFIRDLEKVIAERQQLRPENSYTTELFNAGMSRIAQKVGEESVEVILAALEKDDQAFCGEVADLLFHLLVLLRAKNLSLNDVIQILKARK